MVVLARGPRIATASAHGCGALRGFVAFGDVTADVYCVC